MDRYARFERRYKNIKTIFIERTFFIIRVTTRVFSIVLEIVFKDMKIRTIHYINILNKVIRVSIIKFN